MKLHYLLFFLLVGPAFNAQTKPCKAGVKANRHKIIVMREPQLAGYSMAIQNKVIEVRHTTDADEIQLHESGVPTITFRAKGMAVQPPHYIDYHKTGKIKTADSIGTGPGGHQKNYFFMFHSSHVWISRNYFPSGQLATCTWYRQNGQDSVQKEWYSTGVPKSVLAHGLGQTDSIAMLWDSTTVLRHSLVNDIEHLYYPNGVLQSRSLLKWPHTSIQYSEAGIIRELTYDTLIQAALCTHKKTYHPNGVLQSLEYYSNFGPCLTWSIYSPEGVLKQKINKGPVLVAGNPPPEVYAPEPADGPWMFVEQMPEFPGGPQRFREYMEAGLADVLCRSDVALQGSFQMLIQIQNDGSVKCQSNYGSSQGNLWSLLYPLLEQMPKWKPGRRQGLVVNDSFLLEFEVQDRAQSANR